MSDNLYVIRDEKINDVSTYYPEKIVDATMSDVSFEAQANISPIIPSVSNTPMQPILPKTCEWRLVTRKAGIKACITCGESNTSFVL